MSTTAFDLAGPLPVGTTVLEASAGTGKTFTIAALVARYIAEGVAVMDSLLVVSFSRDSTRELRERVRERLVSTRDGLAGAEPVDPADDVLRRLVDVSPGERELRRRRLEDALASFDAATVTTTHGFSRQVLTALGTAGGADPDVTLLERPDDLVGEVVTDLYLRKWGAPGAESPTVGAEEFAALARSVAEDPATTLVPHGPVGGVPELRVRVAEAVLRELEVRKRRQQLITFDDMLARLARTLEDPMTGAAAKARLRARYRIVLVDEFQDTDPVQWAILRGAFHGVSTLVLIGDPKQAIYRFRGADVAAYLDAVGAAESVSTLQTNWRSDAPLLDGLSAVLGSAALGDERIRVVSVSAAHPGRMVAAPAPVRLRVLPRADLTLTSRNLVPSGLAREIVVDDLVAQTVDLLGSGVTMHPRDGSPPRPLRPGDIAVLVRTGSQALQAQVAMQRAGLPVVVSSRSSVFATRAAQEWLLLLEALEQPHRPTRVRRFALGCFAGWRADQLDAAGHDGADTLALKLRVWGQVLGERGVAALFETVSLEESVQPRLLAREGGERLLTDLRHIAEVLHSAALEGQLGLSALLTWLRRRRREADGDGSQERSRRLESDADALQVLTVHTSKGLEFPVVMVPFAWSYHFQKPATALFHEAGHRVRDVGGPGSPDWALHVAAHRAEEVDDELRLAYVALTRAQSHLLVWWAPTPNTPSSPLHRLLFHDDPETVAPHEIDVPDEHAIVAALRRRAELSRGSLHVEKLEPMAPGRWSPPAAPPARLAPAVFGRDLDTRWRRTSYSALTATAHEQGTPGRGPDAQSAQLGSEPEQGRSDDEPATGQTLAPEPLPAASGDDPALRAVASAWHELPGGTGFGTLVHAVLERLPHGGDLGAAVAEQAARLAPDIDVELLVPALDTALSTPLGPLVDGLALASLPDRDRLAELDFELPLAGGDDPVELSHVLTDLVPLWRRHCPDGPLSDYADALAQLEALPLRGYLTGSIDAVLRVGAQAGERFVVVDYKTNRLGPREEPLTAWHYRPAAMERAMIESHYPLQALLYDIALHRYLRWRIAGYDPERHLGGALYLFLRGMSGPGVLAEDGSVPGVFAWRPPAALVTEASDLLAARVPA